MNNRNDEIEAWLNEPSSTSDDRTLDLFFEYYVLSEQETLTDQEKVKLSALKKSLFGDGAPTNEELSQYHYLFVNAPAQPQTGQQVTGGVSIPTYIYADDGERELHRIIKEFDSPKNCKEEIRRLCSVQNSGWKKRNNQYAVYRFVTPDGFDDGEMQVDISNGDAFRQQKLRLAKKLKESLQNP